ncbi:MAG: hypothetical protein P1V51_20170 [Deltaproteobacteria bacterium]|nr:hypothetical protein [Deltaproteobacteria bacterium]
MKASTQKIVASLKKHGIETMKIEPRKGITREGVTIFKIRPGLVGVLANCAYAPAAVRQALEAEGLTVTTREHTAPDALFVL